jgi:hypothetical protein
VDGRAAALGGTGLGLDGGSFSARNPADMALFRKPAIGLTLAPENVNVETPGGANSTGRSRVSVLQAVVPIGAWAFGFGFSQELDLDWTVLVSDTLRTGFGTFPFEERREHNGALSSVNFSALRRIGPVALGAEFDVLTGNLRQTFQRNFEPEIDDPNNNIGFAAGEARWGFKSYRLRGGLAGRIPRIATFSAVVSWTSRLEAERDTAAAAVPLRTFDMPLEIALGSSVRVSESFLVTAAGGWKGWSNTDVSSLDFASADVWWLGGGVEYSNLTLLGIPLPLRVGYRFSDLPFYETGFEQLTESAFTFGFGTSFAGGASRFDLGMEVGKRGDLERTGSEESYTRFSISLSLLQR